uniref:Uncharacterized protein n=1 Tax=Alexandrium monilatum TaxID=311494 RepID=A0A7S4RSV5_9DINO
MAAVRFIACAFLVLLSLASAGRSFRKGHAAKGRQSPDDEDEFEYGDKEMQVSKGDASDFSVHQFLVDDDARVATPSVDSASTAESIARDKAYAADDHFNSEDTPDSSDSFAQTGRASTKAHSASKRRSAHKKQMPDEDQEDEFEYGDRESQVTHGDAADFSVHQFLVDDDARNGNTDDNIATNLARQKAEAADDHFNSEDTPDNSDSFAQTGHKARKAAVRKAKNGYKGKQVPGDDDDEADAFEYGDRESQVSRGDAADFSVHQFLVDDDARNGNTNDDIATTMAKEKALAADDHFNSEDTPDRSDSFAQTGRRTQKA